MCSSDLFPEPAKRCGANSEFWQVGAHFHDAPQLYYRVRWTEPYRFIMTAISEKPFADCTIDDPKGNTQPDLFGPSAQ